MMKQKDAFYGLSFYNQPKLGYIPENEPNFSDHHMYKLPLSQQPVFLKVDHSHPVRDLLSAVDYESVAILFRREAARMLTTSLRWNAHDKITGIDFSFTWLEKIRDRTLAETRERMRELLSGSFQDLEDRKVHLKLPSRKHRFDYLLNQIDTGELDTHLKMMSEPFVRKIMSRYDTIFQEDAVEMVLRVARGKDFPAVEIKHTYRVSGLEDYEMKTNVSRYMQESFLQRSGKHIPVRATMTPAA